MPGRIGEDSRVVRLFEFNQLKQIFHFLVDDETFIQSTRICTGHCGYAVIIIMLRSRDTRTLMIS